MAEEIFECPICGAELEEGIDECPECGEPLAEKEEFFECPICGTELEERVEECPECGEPFKEDSEKNKAIERLTKISGLGEQRAIKLYEEGFESPEDILERGMEGIAGINQIGVRTAEKIIDGAENLVEKEEKVEGLDEEDIEKGETFEDEEGLEEDEEEVVEKTKEDLKTTVEKDVEKETKRIIIAENIKKNPKDLIPIISAFLIPVFLLLLITLELVVILLDYTSIYPTQSLYYFTPLPFVVSSWLASLVFSFLVVLALFTTTWKGFIFTSAPNFKLDKSMVFFSTIFSLIISISLMVHLYYSKIYSGIVLTIVLLVLSLFMLISELEILRKKKISFPRIVEKKACMNCGGVMALDLENCPRCGSKIAVLEESISTEEERGFLSITISSLKSKLWKEKKYLEDESVLEEGIAEPEKEITEAEEKIEGPEEEVLETPEEIPEPPKEETPEPEDGIGEPEEEVSESEKEISGLKDKGVFSKSFSGIIDSIRKSWNSIISLFQTKIRNAPKALEEEPVSEEKEGLESQEKGVCPSCHAVIPFDSEECPKCGEELEPSEKELEEEEVLESQLKELEKAVEKVEGKKIEPSPLVCPICGSEVEKEANECPECGEPITEEKENKAIEELMKIPGLGKNRAMKLYEEGFKNPEEILENGMKGLAGINQIGVRTAEQIINGAEKVVEEKEISEEKTEEEKKEDVLKSKELEDEIPESKGGLTQSVGKMANSVKDKWSSSLTYLQEKIEEVPNVVKNLKPFEKEEFEKKEEIEDVEEKEEEKEEKREEKEEEKMEEAKKEEQMEEETFSFRTYRPQSYEIDEEKESEGKTEKTDFVCPICDAELEADLDECPECGTVFVEDKEEDEVEEEGIVEGVLKEDDEI